MSDYSQHGESLILEQLFEKIGTDVKFAVEFGAADGFYLSNARYFIEKGWKALQMDYNANVANGVKSEFIKVENINNLLKKYEVPASFDLLSIDLDGNDWHIFNVIDNRARVVIIEYNSNFPIDKLAVMEYDDSHIFDGTYGYGASFASMVKLAQDKGYYLYQQIGYCNLIFVLNEYREMAEPIIDYSSFTLPMRQHKQETTKRFYEL